MKITALLTGRGNNTLPDKNVLIILGKPVLYYPAHSGRKCALITDWYCSSDDEKILDAAAHEGYKRIVRPIELAQPTSQHIDAIMHALYVMKEMGELPDICVVLLANNVTIKSQWITECIEILLNNNSATAVVPVYTEYNHHPLRAKIMNNNGSLSMYIQNAEKSISTNRQDLSPCYFLSHNFWVLRVSSLLSGKQGQPPWNFMGDMVVPYFVSESIDIHSTIDLMIAREWIKNNYED